jgi:acyl-CoA synthetase (AMP-forming)/AMP-acid ligase II
MTRAPRLRNLAQMVCYYGTHFAQREAAVEISDANHIAQENARMTYAELAARVEAGGQALRACGVYEGARVAFFGFPGFAYLETLVGCHAADVVYVGLNPKYTTIELQYVLSHATPCIVIVDPRVSAAAKLALQTAIESRESPHENALFIGLFETSLANTLQTLSPSLQPPLALPYPIVARDAAALVYTSGTTGKPKGAVIRHQGLVHEGLLFAKRYLNDDVSRTTRVLNNLPVNHIGCIGDLTGAWLVMAATIVFMPHFEPTAIGAVLEQERITFWFQVPAMFQLTLQSGVDITQLPHLTDIGWGGAPCPLPLIQMLAASGAKLSNTYGLSEGTGTSTTTLAKATVEQLAQSVGVALEPDTVRIDETGELQLQGNLVFAGYLNDAAASAQAFTDDGWFRTGDIGAYDAQGNIMLIGRMKEMFKSGGYNVYPREVEASIETCPGVTLAAVIPVPDDLWTEVGHAFVTANTELDASTLRNHLSTRLANYKIPKHFTFSKDLPRLPIGKIDKQALRSLT